MAGPVETNFVPVSLSSFFVSLLSSSSCVQYLRSNEEEERKERGSEIKENEGIKLIYRFTMMSCSSPNLSLMKS